MYWDYFLFNGIWTMVPILTLKQEKQDLYGQILIYYFYYLNCRNVSIHNECDNRESSGAFSMREFLIDAIITLTISLFVISILMIPFFLLGIINF